MRCRRPFGRSIRKRKELMPKHAPRSPRLFVAAKAGTESGAAPSAWRRRWVTRPALWITSAFSFQSTPYGAGSSCRTTSIGRFAARRCSSRGRVNPPVHSANGFLCCPVFFRRLPASFRPDFQRPRDRCRLDGTGSGAETLRQCAWTKWPSPRRSSDRDGAASPDVAAN